MRKLIGCLLLVCCLGSSSVWSQAVDEDSVEAPEFTDVRVVIDISGSMKKNDPANLRKPALELLLQLLPDTSKAGVWTFGQYVNMLVSHGEVSDVWTKRAARQTRHITSNGLFTNIGEALEKAAYDRDIPNTNYQTHIILLTDGMVDIDKDPEKNQLERQRILESVLPDIESSGFTLHTIALSDHADKKLMDELALTTGGVSAVAHTADELMKVFLRIFDQTTPAEQLPLSDNRFLVDSSIEEFTALIFRQPGSSPTRLLSPDGEEYQFEEKATDVNWYRTDQYDLVTLQQPVEGEWQVLADVAPDSRITIVSNLNLFLKPLPNNVFWDQTLDLSLLMQDQEGTITDADFLRLLTVTGAVHQLEQDGDAEVGKNETAAKEVWQKVLSGEVPPTDGIYSAQLDVFHQAGGYKLTVVVDGKSFQRQLTHYMQVREVEGMIPPAKEPEPAVVEEAVVEETKVNEEPAPTVEPEKELPEETLPAKMPDWLLYAVIGGGNLLLLFIAFMAYRLVMGTGKDDSLKELEQAVSDAEADTDETPDEKSAQENDDPKASESAENSPELESDPEPENRPDAEKTDDIAPIEMEEDEGLM
ncbi:VWA domain-containing protein, partial [Pseudomaricurvus sp.]|uniref:VWA domain-containing protein n=1 Tax=Pseudomaricurvus sp. TaxID=2004510 RepID=UPI003F6CA125